MCLIPILFPVRARLLHIFSTANTAGGHMHMREREREREGGREKGREGEEERRRGGAVSAVCASWGTNTKIKKKAVDRR